jgi:hypothetical protein
MTRRALDIGVVVVSVILVLLLTYERDTIEQKRRPSVYSTYDTGPNGYRALFEVLQAAGVPVHRFEAPLETLGSSTRTLVITGYENDRSAQLHDEHDLDENDMDFLRSFVSGGGRMVAIDPQFAGRQDVTPGVGTTLQTPGGGDALALARNAFTAGVARASGTIDWTFPFKEPRGIPLLANNHGMVAVWYRFGRGEVIGITAPALFGNAQLRHADNLRFAYNAIAGHGPVAFDEYVHGYDESLTMWGALPAPVHAAVWIVVALAVIGLIGANVPFAPAYLTDPPDERDSSGYIAALAELMRRSRRRPSDDDVIAQAMVDFQRRKEHA